MTSSTSSLASLRDQPSLFKNILRGIEKEGLRVDGKGFLAATPHPRAFGSALANPHITTDYSEALLEMITGTHNGVEGLLEELHDTHRFVAANLAGEMVWNQSMPAHLPDEADIPIAWYGTSNTGMLKHVYRRGLAERYGKTMQCIAGLHYNFSVPDTLWDLLGITGASAEDQRSKGYLSLIRNFNRYSWLLMYLFGCSPAVSVRFLRGMPGHTLSRLDDDTLYLPHATSLRMSDLGYKNETQSELQLCYNDIETFLTRLYDAVTTPWPQYQAIGTHRDGEWIQLNTNVLQIENEYYSSIRPKRATGRCERPVTALAARGVQYVEVRCLDIDPFEAVGISAQTCHFMDTFLLFCAAEESPFFPNGGICTTSHNNFGLVAKEGRRPGLTLINEDTPVALSDWGRDILDRMRPYAELLDHALGENGHAAAVEAQRPKIHDTEQTPSARLLRLLRDEGVSMHDFSLRQSRRHHEALLATPISASRAKVFEAAAARSVEEQARLERGDTEDFAAYVARYHAALKRP
ncbi:MAG TPA: glutamate--cysteine ligase [Burkholderiaceae bacterium]|nr:glutamate--cysteine ligase [Burkholderiaceae bacterium]